MLFVTFPDSDLISLISRLTFVPITKTKHKFCSKPLLLSTETIKIEIGGEMTGEIRFGGFSCHNQSYQTKKSELKSVKN